MSAVMSLPLSEDKAMGVVREALLKAGRKIGVKGDHWPIVTMTLQSLFKDWEDVKTERAVRAEMKQHLYHQLEIMERLAPNADEATRKLTQPKLKRLRQLYDFYFEDKDPDQAFPEGKPLPMHVQRAAAILEELEA